MRRRVVIADAGPLIALARIDSLTLLARLFGRIFIPSTVRDEILPAGASFPDADAFARTLAGGWIEVVDAPSEDEWRPLNPGVDAGEASAIRLAVSVQTATSIDVCSRDLNEAGCWRSAWPIRAA